MADQPASYTQQVAAWVWEDKQRQGLLQQQRATCGSLAASAACTYKDMLACSCGGLLLGANGLIKYAEG